MALAENEIEFVSVNGVQKKFADTTARKAIDDLGTEVKNLDFAKFNDVAWTNITANCEIIEDRLSALNIYATKVSGIIIMEIDAAIDIEPSQKTANILKINDERFYLSGAGSTTIGTALAYYTAEPYIRVGRFNMIANNIIGIGESNIISIGALRSQIIAKALNP